MYKQLQRPGLDCLSDSDSDRRFSRMATDFMVGDPSREVDSQNVPKAPLVKHIELSAGLHDQIPHFGAIKQDW